ncbi:hypothetical protein TUN199_02509 [Pyrenophora tritici-repentis]|nr:hypothetical protein Alg130_10804 [Pyrenophora tritici-repentis]KAI0613548.1 hypothetical protein TUN205_02257 [Pyrenophora tritici-repentis]KAI0625544.1 hypothetical protein TUN199_02509 [Pyrenophora tritici-repentis]
MLFRAIPTIPIADYCRALVRLPTCNKTKEGKDLIWGFPNYQRP